MKRPRVLRLPSLCLAGFAAVFAVAAMSVRPAAAQGQGTPEQRQACSGDAQRLCGEFIPDATKISACLAKKRSSLSPACKAVFTRPTKKKRRHT
jgi:hypothetical protein